MDQLAPELLSAVVVLLDIPDLVSLSACSKGLGKFVEPILYGSEENRNKAIRWACVHGNLKVIRQAVANGNSPSYVKSLHQEDTDGKMSVLVTTLTLFLAAKNKQPDVFLLFLRLGARVDELRVVGTRSQVKKIMRWLSSQPELLKAFLEKRRDIQVKAMHCPDVAWPLIPAITSGASPALVRLLVDRGASPNQVLYRKKPSIQSPLSAAISRRSEELFDLLIEKGANIHGRDVHPPINIPTQIPVFAAAKAMAESDEGWQMMRLCLRHGAKTDQYAGAVNKEQKLYWTTPLLVYLDSVTWDADWPHQKVLDELAYLFEAPSTSPPPEGCSRHLSSHHPWDNSPYPIEFLIDKWRMEMLVDKKYLSIIERLAQHTNVAGLILRLISKYAFSLDPTRTPSAAGWCRLLEVLLPRLNVDINDFLFQVIVIQGKTTQHAGLSAGLGDLYHATIDILLAHGADINTRSTSQGTTALHTLSEYYSHVSTDPNPLTNYAQTNPAIRRQRCQLFELLKKKGADPTIAAEDGKTAIEQLLSGLDRATACGKPFVLELAAILRTDESAAPVRSLDSLS